MHIRGAILPSLHLDSSVRGSSCGILSEGASSDKMSSAPRPGGAANSFGVESFTARATASNEPIPFLQNAMPHQNMHRESVAANASFEFRQENEYRGTYPSPVGTPVAFHYDGMSSQLLAQPALMNDNTAGGLALPAQVVADRRLSVPQHFDASSR